LPQVLVLNSGSSSIKYRLFGADDRERAAGLVERIGEPTGRASHRVVVDGEVHEQVHEAPVADHEVGFAGIVDVLGRAGLADGLAAIGHRVVHGGEEFHEPTVIDGEVLERIRALVPLAPLHNPANLTGIEVARRLRPEVPQVAVFDTAFHRTLPEAASRYAVPEEYVRDHGVRRYGFHGTSHTYVAKRAAEHLGRPLEELAMVTLHLGNGASATAIDGGRSVETSMGLSPLEGLVMGTRSGDIDPAAIFHLIRRAGLSADEVETVLNRRSGLLGLCGDNDLRAVGERAAAGDPVAELALEIYCHRIRKYLGAYAAVLGRLDAVVFTAGVGENSVVVRERVCARLGVLGVELDEVRNRGGSPAGSPTGVRSIGREGGRVAILVVATDEEREIADQTRAALRML
jgi:acetate kinase